MNELEENTEQKLHDAIKHVLLELGQDTTVKYGLRIDGNKVSVPFTFTIEVRHGNSITYVFNGEESFHPPAAIEYAIYKCLNVAHKAQVAAELLELAPKL